MLADGSPHTTKQDLPPNRRTLRALPWRVGMALALASIANAVVAGGLYVSQLATPGSVGTAGVVNPVNDFGADSAWTNPAGMAWLDRSVVTSGLQVIASDTRLDIQVAEAGGTRGGNAAPATASPSLFGVRLLGDDWRVGIGISGLLGGGVDFGNAFAGRYAVNKALLAGVGISPSFSYRVNDRLSVGAGLSIVYTVLTEDISIRQPGFPDGEVIFDKLDDFGLQAFAGVQYRPNDRLLLGLVYRSESDVEVEGDLDFERLAIPFDLTGDIEVDWEYPQVLEAGARYWLSERLSVAVNTDWEDWSAFSANRFEVALGPVSAVTALDRRWKDTWHVGAAAIYETDGHSFGAGIGYDSSAVDDEDRTLDLAVDEQWRFGIGYHRKRERGPSYSLALTVLYAGDAPVDQIAQGVRVRTEFDNNLIYFVSSNFTWRF